MPEAEDTTRYYVKVWRKGVDNYWTWRNLTKTEAVALMKRIENKEVWLDNIQDETDKCIMQVTDFSDVWTAKMFKET